MIMYLYGPDTYRRTKELQGGVIKKFLEKYPDGIVQRFYLDEKGELEKLSSFLMNRNLFEKSKIGIIYEVDPDEKEHRNLLKEAVTNSETTLVIVADKKLPKTFDFLLKEPVKSFPFEFKLGADFIAFLKKEVQSQNLLVGEEIIKQVGARYAGDSWQAMTELYNLAFGEKSKQYQASTPFFPLIQSLKSSSTGTRLRSLFETLETVDPAQAFNMLATLVSGGDKIKMADYDVAVKSGKLDYEEALLEFVLG